MRIGHVSPLLLALLVCASGFPAPSQAQLLTARRILEREAPRPDALFSYGPDTLQFAELWLPAGAGPHPVAVLVHGGCWSAALPGTETIAFLAEWLRRQGVAAWSVEYRRVGHAGGGYPGTFLDVADGTDYLREVAARYSLDLERVIAVGHSAGGHLALWLAARARLPVESELFRAAPTVVRGAVSLGGVPDLKGHYFRDVICGDGMVGRLVGMERRGEERAFRDTSPAELLPLGVRQILIHGVFDHAAPPVLGYRYREKAEGQGETVDLILVDDAGHFEVIAPWTPPFSRIGPAILQLLE